MLRIISFSAIMFCLLVTACSDEATTQTPNNTVIAKPMYDNFKTGVILDIKGRTENNLAYSLYLPQGYNAHSKIPIVLLLDAHSRTHTSIKQYIATCDALHIAIACSANCRNGLDVNVTNNIVQKTLDDILSRVHVDSTKIYLAGFSGGARVAGAAAATDSRIKGVVACAAGFEPGVTVPCVLIAGLKDMNSTELFQLHQTLKIPHGFMVFDGIHAWPPDSLIRMGLKGLLTNNVNTLTQAIVLNAIFTKAMMDNENYQRPLIQQLFQNNNWDELLKRVNTMKILSQTEKHPDAKAMQQRLLAYCGMLCYFTVPKAPDIDKALQVYELCDAANPDVWFFKAIHIAKTDKARAKQYLTKAASLGFYDYEKLSQNPELLQLTDEALLKRITDNN